jgi:transcriptional regulator with XRE-family HTH domain
MTVRRNSERHIDMTKMEQLFRSLEDAAYRRAFADDVGTGLAFQTRLLREDRGWTQEEMAARMGKSQATISQWENPAYGSYTLNTLKELAGAFDVALMVRFAPFSEIVEWSVGLTSVRLAPPSFEEESRIRRAPIATDSTEGSITVSATTSNVYTEVSDLRIAGNSNQYANAA